MRMANRSESQINIEGERGQIVIRGPYSRNNDLKDSGWAAVIIALYSESESLAILADVSFKALLLIALKCAKPAFFDFYPKGFTSATHVELADSQ